MAMTGLFITGTDTDVGKTLASALLLSRAAELYPYVGYHKPIQTGSDADKDRLIELVPPGIGPITQGLSFKKPLSPYVAARYQHESIDFARLVATTKDYCHQQFTIVEGAGGLLVPIDHRHFMIDLIKELGLSSVLVARSKLGTINHTLLSLEAIRARSIPLAGVIMMGEPNQDNEDAIRSLGRIEPVLALPWLPSLNRAAVQTLLKTHQIAIDELLGA